MSTKTAMSLHQKPDNWKKELLDYWKRKHVQFATPPMTEETLELLYVRMQEEKKMYNDKEEEEEEKGTNDISKHWEDIGPSDGGHSQKPKEDTSDEEEGRWSTASSNDESFDSDDPHLSVQEKFLRMRCPFELKLGGEPPKKNAIIWKTLTNNRIKLEEFDPTDLVGKEEQKGWKSHWEVTASSAGA